MINGVHPGSGDLAEGLLDQARLRVRAEAGAVEALADHLGPAFLDAVRLVSARTGKVVTAGVGTSGPVARRMAHLLSTSGTSALYLHPTDALHGSLGAIEEGDVILAATKGGESDELNEFLRRARARGARVVVITAVAGSAAAREADVVAYVPDTPDGDPGGIVAMGSSLAASAWGDALAYVLQELSGYSWDEVLHSHPNGAVGRRARETGEHGG